MHRRMEAEAIAFAAENPSASDEAIQEHLEDTYGEYGIDPATLLMLITGILKLINFLKTLKA